MDAVTETLGCEDSGDPTVPDKRSAESVGSAEESRRSEAGFSEDMEVMSGTKKDEGVATGGAEQSHASSGVSEGEMAELESDSGTDVSLNERDSREEESSSNSLHSTATGSDEETPIAEHRLVSMLLDLDQAHFSPQSALTYLRKHTLERRRKMTNAALMRKSLRIFIDKRVPDGYADVFRSLGMVGSSSGRFDDFRFGVRLAEAVKKVRELAQAFLHDQVAKRFEEGKTCDTPVPVSRSEKSTQQPRKRGRHVAGGPFAGLDVEHVGPALHHLHSYVAAKLTLPTMGRTLYVPVKYRADHDEPYVKLYEAFGLSRTPSHKHRWSIDPNQECSVEELRAKWQGALELCQDPDLLALVPKYVSSSSDEEEDVDAAPRSKRPRTTRYEDRMAPPSHPPRMRSARGTQKLRGGGSRFQRAPPGMGDAFVPSSRIPRRRDSGLPGVATGVPGMHSPSRGMTLIELDGTLTKTLGAEFQFVRDFAKAVEARSVSLLEQNERLLKTVENMKEDLVVLRDENVELRRATRTMAHFRGLWSE